MSLEKFNQLKAEFTKQEQVVMSIQNDLTKNGTILVALQNELRELIQRQKAKLAEIGELNADEYVELKQQNEGYKARIEYYQAQKEEIEEKAYQAKEKLHLIYNELKQVRSKYLYQQANDLLEKLFIEKQAEFNKIYCYLMMSDKFKVDELISDDTQDKAIMRYFCNQFEARIKADDKVIDEEFKIRIDVLNEFKPKSPATIHAQRFDNTPKGFTRLIHNLQGDKK